MSMFTVKVTISTEQYALQHVTMYEFVHSVDQFYGLYGHRTIELPYYNIAIQQNDNSSFYCI